MRIAIEVFVVEKRNGAAVSGDLHNIVVDLSHNLPCSEDDYTKQCREIVLSGSMDVEIGWKELSNRGRRMRRVPPPAYLC